MYSDRKVSKHYLRLYSNSRKTVHSQVNQKQKEYLIAMPRLQNAKFKGGALTFIQKDM